MNTIIKRYVPLVILFPLVFFLMPFFVHAQIHVNDEIADTLGGIVDEKILEETGLDKVLDAQDISADRIIKDAIGDIPSPLLGSLLHQLWRSHVPPGLKPGAPSRDGLFEPYTWKRPGGEADLSSVNTICQRTANTRMWEGMQNAEAKAHFAPWVEIAWTSIKSIADGGKTITELIAENTKEKVKEIIKENIFEKAPPEIERVTVNHHDSCGTITVILWDAQEGKLKIETSGDCGCKRYQSEGDFTYLNKFKVNFEADVKLKNIELEEKTVGLIFKKTVHKILAYYKISNIKVDTNAECSRSCPVDLSDPIEDEPGGGFLNNAWEWITDLFGINDESEGNTEPEDEIDNPPNDTDDDRGFIKRITDAFVGIFGAHDDTNDDDLDDNTDPDNNDSEDDKDSTDDDPSIPKIPEPLKPLACGENIDIDDRTKVPTFPAEVTNDGLFSCGGTCKENQLCVHPDQGIVSGVCTYCQDVCEEGQFRHEFDCNAAKGSNQKCVFAGSRNGGKCYTIEDLEPVSETPLIPSISSSGDCTVPNHELYQLFPTDVFTWTDLDNNQMKFMRSECVTKDFSGMQKIYEEYTLNELRYSCPDTSLISINYTGTSRPCGAIYQF